MRTVEEILKDYARRSSGFDDTILEGRIFHNPNCGDSIRLALADTECGVLLRWNGEGCSLMTAGASLLSLISAGESRDAIKAFASYAIRLASRDAQARIADDAPLPGIRHNAIEAREAVFLFSEFARYPVRRECILLPWNAFIQLLEEM
ncbi:MAG: hypothetical protein LBC99_07380 [Spirochaetota bacterium]|jgi:NifU-like protein involved in Fe-S cluster formation|nr:hypothetical protein [Spirochaetota bacterium]